MNKLSEKKRKEMLESAPYQLNLLATVSNLIGVIANNQRERLPNKSWAAKDAYNKAIDELNNTPMMENLSFGAALEVVKHGGLIARKGWNGKGMFVFMRPGDELEMGVIVNKVKSLPQSVKDYFNNIALDTAGSLNDLPKVQFTPYLCMKAADGSIVNGWLASQTDMLANDWCILDV